MAVAGILFFSEGLAQDALNQELSLSSQKKTANPKAVSLEDARNSKLTITAEVTGIEGEILENVATRLKINLRPAHEKTTQDDIQNFYKKGPEEIQEALKPFGYFHPKITSRLAREGSHQWKAYFYVNPGEAMELKEVELHIIGEGANDPKFQKLKVELIKKIGHTLNVKQYEDAKQDLYELAERRGYFQANVVDSRVMIDMKRYQARLYILFNTGQRYHFGPVTFSSTPLSDRFLQRYVRFKVGEPYSESKVQRLQQDLGDSNYFRKVTIEHKADASGEAPINVKLKVKKARQYIMGGGWGTDTGARGVLGINFRRLNPYGHQLKTDAIIAQYQSNARATYIIPGRNPANDQYRISASVGKLTENPGKAENKKIDLSYQTVYKKWRPTLSLGFLDEKFTLYDYFVLNPIRQQDRLIIPSFSLSKSYGDDPLRPTKGYQINFNVRGADRQVLGKNSFFQARLDLRGLYSLNASQRILLRGSVARTQIKNIFNLPLSLQYYAGGPQSVRGYGYLDIGPGKKFVVASAEFQQKIKGNLYLGVFYDAGSVSEHYFRRTKRSPGVGLIYLSPIGDIEFAVAVPLDKNYPRRGKHVRLQFSVGSELFGFSSKD